VRFPLLDLPRQDPAEELLRTVLLASEPDLPTLRQPMAFPVFGRGRVLYALVGAGINRDVITEACAFLTGSCSCEVKAQNPGMDLLLRADWDRSLGLESATFQELPPLSGLNAAPVLAATPVAVAPVAPAAVSPADANPAVPAPVRLGRRSWALAVAGLVLVTLLAGSLAVLLATRSR
jgi:hypothetical protein